MNLTHYATEYAAALVGALLGYAAARRRYRSRKWPNAARPVYHKCKDCGREHAVYADGRAYALRQNTADRGAAPRKQETARFDG